jgi:putative heme-binding domain-containing protein
VAEVLSLHSTKDQVQPLLKVLESILGATPQDQSFIHTVRIALRESLKSNDAFSRQAFAGLTSLQTQGVARIARLINTAEASTWLLAYLVKNPGNGKELAKSLSSLARNLPDSQEGALVTLARERFGADLDTQLELLASIRQGIAQRGGTPSEPTKQWAGDVAEKLLVAAESESPWTIKPNPGSKDPWGGERRPCQDGQEGDFLSSLPPPKGAPIEKLTGTLLSKPFPCPPTLVFWLAGHRGFPDKPAHEKNFVALVDAASGAELMRANPPRNDIAQQIAWDLRPHQGRSVRVQLTDGDNGSAYAWLAAGRFEPAVVSLRLTNADAYLRSVAEIARELKLSGLAPRLAAAFSKSELSDATRSAIAQALAGFPGLEKVLGELFKTAPTRLQAALAVTLAETKSGAQVLCSTAPPGLLILPAIARKLAALNDPSLQDEVKARTKDLPPPSAEIDALIAARIQGFTAARTAGQADPAKGAQIYTIHCAICHQIGGLGQVVGPQLDGVGNRGLERLCEDILDPNRAVDPMFHLRLLKMKNGTVISGLLRREEGATLVMADVTGRESMAAKEQIEENTETPLSLMPPTFGLSIPEADYYHLMAYLLSQSTPRK